MKKILMIIVIIFILPIMVVNADMGAPIIRPFDAYISNVDGAVVYDNDLKKDIILEYGTEIRVIYEQEGDEKTVYAEVEEGKYYTISIKDIVLLKEEFVIDENEQYVYKLEKVKELTVLKESGVIVYKGPSSAYKEVGSVIPKGTKLEIQYIVDDEWYYIDYNGVKGWICGLNGTLGELEKKNLLISKDLEIKNEEEVVVKIPGNTILNSFYSIDPWSWGYYITYNGVLGFVSEYDVAILYDKNTVSLKRDKILYEMADKNSKVLVENIPANTELEFEYSLGHNVTSWIYTSYNGKTGWVYDPYEELNYENTSTSSDDANNDFNTNNNVENNNISNDVDESVSNDDIIIEDNLFTGQQIILLCVGTAIIISLTACVTVVLINKRNKKKEDLINKNNDTAI